MASQHTEAFMHGLQEAERTGDVAPLVQLFAEDAELLNPARSMVRHGRQDAEAFWREYLGAFRQVHSEFTDVKEGEDFAVLEWKSDAVLPTGEPMSYRGVSLVDFRGDRVSRFRTYYDSAAFLSEGAKKADERGEA